MNQNRHRRRAMVSIGGRSGVGYFFKALSTGSRLYCTTVMCTSNHSLYVMPLKTSQPRCSLLLKPLHNNDAESESSLPYNNCYHLLLSFCTEYNKGNFVDDGRINCDLYKRDRSGANGLKQL
jgi:hypothetical protein